MKKILVLIILLLTTSLANAEPPNKGLSGPTKDSKDYARYKEFRREVFPLKEKYVKKKLEIEKELLKDKPDQNSLKELYAEKEDLKNKILEVMKKHGIDRKKIAAQKAKKMN